MSGWGDEEDGRGGGGGGGGSGWSDELARSIQKINANTAEMKRMVGQLGTGKDNATFRDRMRRLTESTKPMIKHANDTLRQQRGVARDGAERLRVGKLADQYSSAVKAFEDVATLSAKRQREIVVQMSMASGGASPLDVGSPDEPNLAQAQAYQSVDVDVALVRERNEDVAALESDLINLHELTVDMATLVHEQQEGIDVIEDNVTKASDNVKEGVGQLREANKYQKKSRRKMCYIMLALVICAAIIIVPSVVCTSAGTKC